MAFNDIHTLRVRCAALLGSPQAEPFFGDEDYDLTDDMRINRALFERVVEKCNLRTAEFPMRDGWAVQSALQEIGDLNYPKDIIEPRVRTAINAFAGLGGQLTRMEAALSAEEPAEDTPDRRDLLAIRGAIDHAAAVQVALEALLEKYQAASQARSRRSR